MKNKELIKIIIKKTDKLDMNGCENMAYSGYELASILCLNYEKPVANIVALLYLKWLDGADFLLERLQFFNKIAV